MTKETIVVDIKAKLDDLIMERNDTKNSVTLSENTVHTKLNKLSREIRNLTLINMLLTYIDDDREIYFTDNIKEYYNTLVRLSDEKAAYVARGTVTLNEGDKLMDLLKKYVDTKDVYGKIMKEAGKNGLVMNADGVFVRA